MWVLDMMLLIALLLLALLLKHNMALALSEIVHKQVLVEALCVALH